MFFNARTEQWVGQITMRLTSYLDWNPDWALFCNIDEYDFWRASCRSTIAHHPVSQRLWWTWLCHPCDVWCNGQCSDNRHHKCIEMDRRSRLDAREKEFLSEMRPKRLQLTSNRCEDHIQYLFDRFRSIDFRKGCYYSAIEYLCNQSKAPRTFSYVCSSFSF